MATQSKKTAPVATPPVVRKASPATVTLLALSLAANLGLAGWLVRATRGSSDTAVSSSSLQPSAPAPNPSAVALSPELTSYAAIGSYLAENNHIPALKWTKDQFRAFQRGVRASYEGHGFAMDERGAKLRDEISAKVQAMLESNGSNPIDDYFRTLREKEGVQRSPTGLHYRITQEGFGAKPGPNSTVIASYAARLPDGKAIPSLTRARARSAVRDLLPGLGEGVQLLNPGGKALIYLSPALSFRDGEWPADVPKGAPIIFFLELHAVE